MASKNWISRTAKKVRLGKNLLIRLIFWHWKIYGSHVNPIHYIMIKKWFSVQNDLTKTVWHGKVSVAKKMCKNGLFFGKTSKSFFPFIFFCRKSNPDMKKKCSLKQNLWFDKFSFWKIAMKSQLSIIEWERMFLL